MKIRSILAATVVFAGSLAFAQVCPTGSTCLVPAQGSGSLQGATTYTMPMASATTTTIVPYSGGMVAVQPMAVQPMCPSMGVSTIGTQPMYSMYSLQPMSVQPSYPTYGVLGMQQTYPMYSAQPTGMQAVSTIGSTCAVANPDTACIVNQIGALRGDVRSMQGQIRAASLELRGQQLVNRMNQLMADEMMFRQRISSNPSWPEGQATAMQISEEANALNRDIAAYNRELSMIPADQRVYVAPELNTFTVAYWNPTMQRFSQYQTQFAQSSSVYQPAFASNPWLQPWYNSYQASLNNIANDQQVFASNSWWSGTQVLGSMEVYPMTGVTTGSMMTLPAGAVIYIPASSMGISGITGTTTVGTVVTPPSVATTETNMGVAGTTETYGGTAETTTTTTTTETTTTPETTETTTMPETTTTTTPETTETTTGTGY